MARRLTVFYSWQSDTPPDLNRDFIEKALQEALSRLHSDAKLESALRDTKVELDKDTKGVSGSPPITETILRKIQDCAVFVADLTFVGESKTSLTDLLGEPRQFPNPNVLIEYGYALRCHTHKSIVGIMNTAYGKPDTKSLPFDLRHLRWPIQYQLEGIRFLENKEEEFEALVKKLVEAIGLVLSKSIAPQIEVEKFIPRKATKNAAIFFEDGGTHIPESWHGPKESFMVPDGAAAYLRLYPTVAVPPLETELEARSLIVTGNLQPLGRTSGCSIGRNLLGAIVYESPDKKLFHFTQLFLSREIWGADARFLNTEHQVALCESVGAPVVINYIAGSYLEQYFAKGLHNYLSFAQKHLQLPHPLRIEAGLVGIQNYSIASYDNYNRGRSLRDVIEWQCDVEYGKPIWEILEPFFKKVWANCDVLRKPDDQARLASECKRAGLV